MAKHNDTPKGKMKGKGTSIVVWILMAMLVLGLGGFGITNFGGGISTIGKVGDREIDVNDYNRALQQELKAFSAQVGETITLQQAQTLGLDRQVRQQLITSAALDNESARVGLSVGDVRLVDEIRAMQAFQGPAGGFDRESYRYALQQSNFKEAEFEARVREDIARSVLNGAVMGGFAGPSQMVDTLYSYIAERRGFTLLRLSEADLSAPLSEPTAQDMMAQYEANAPLYTAPEAKRITYAALLPEMLADTMEIDESLLRATYDERIAEFVQPERRLVERLVFVDDAAAAAAKAKLDAGESFDALVAERGLQLDDIDLGDVALEDLGTAGAAVFVLEGPGVVGPFESDLGPALFRMNAILSAQETTFDEARDTLAAELGQDAARRAIDDQIEAIDDHLAGGATLEDLAKESNMQLGTLDFNDAADAPIVGYPAFREAANQVASGDFPEVIRLDDGGIVALRLDEIVPPALKPFDAVVEQVMQDWRAATRAAALSARAAEIKAAVEAGANIGASGIVDVTLQITRDGFIENTPADLLAAVFKMTPGETRIIDTQGFVGIVQLDAVIPAPQEGPDAEALKAALSAQAGQAIAQDAFMLFSNALTAEAGISLNDAAISAVHAQFR